MPQLKTELERLIALRTPDLFYLADLGSRLAALASYLGGHAELRALAEELESGQDAETLWHRAITVLTTLTGGSDSGSTRRPFWKRS